MRARAFHLARRGAQVQPGLAFVRPLLPFCTSVRDSGAEHTCPVMGKGGGFYAVRNGKGGFSGVLKTWAEAEIYIKGASGCKQKKFQTRAEAEAFASGGATSAGVKKAIGKRTKTKDPPRIKGDVLTVYTDGACGNNGKSGARAGYGVFFGFNHERNISEPLPGTPQTNQRAEMTAVLHAMRTAFQHDMVTPQLPLRIYTDSSYTLKGITQWIDGWKKKGWKTTASTDVKNRDLWEQLDFWRYRYKDAGIRYELIWVKGHNSDPGNEAADRLAVAGAAKAS